MIRAGIVLLLSCLVVLSQPAPILRNAMTTNIAGTPVRSVNNLSVTNATTALGYTNWEFFNVGPNTVARLIDISNIVSSVSGSATNAISTIQSNGVTVTAMATNLDFVDSSTVLVLMTNNPSGHVHVSFAVDPAVVAFQTNLTSASNVLYNITITSSNFLYGIVGETNWLGDAGTTNATRIGLADGKVNNTNLVKTLMAGNGIVLTNNVGGTNVMIAIDPAVVATQTDLNAASNVLRTDITNLQGATNFLNAFRLTNVISLSTTNATSKPLTNSFVDGVLVLRGLEAGTGISLTANPSNYVIAATATGGGSLAIETNRVNLGTETNLNFITGNAISVLATNLSGTNDVQFTFTTFIDITSPPYNAKGDGTTDDTLAFQNACTNVGANIAVPYRAAGYLITNVFITNGVTLFGAGGQSKLIFGPAAIGEMLNGTNCGAITIRNLELDGTNNISWQSVPPGGTRKAIQLMAYNSNSKVQNVYAHGFDHSSIFITSTNNSTDVAFTLSSNNVSVSHCDFRRCFYAVYIDNFLAQYIKVSDCRSWECAYAYVVKSMNCLFTDCEATLCDRGFDINGTNSFGRITISDCILNNNNTPLSIVNSTNGVLVTGCQIWGGTNSIASSGGVHIENCIGGIDKWSLTANTFENWVRNNLWWSTNANTITRVSTERTIFSENFDELGNVIGDFGFYAKSNVVFQGNSSFTNASGTNFIAGYQRVNASIVSNSFALLNFGPQVGSIWTCTNATTGEGRWSTNQGFIILPVQSCLPPTNAAAALDQGTNNTWRLLFDDTANEQTFYQFPLPWGYYTNLNITLSYSTLAAAANKSNVWEIASMVIPGAGGLTINADSYNGATEFTQQVNSTAGYINTATISCNATSGISGDMLKLRITRKGTNTFDNNTGDTAVHGIMVTFERKAL